MKISSANKHLLFLLGFSFFSLTRPVLAEKTSDSSYDPLEHLDEGSFRSPHIFGEVIRWTRRVLGYNFTPSEYDWLKKNYVNPRFAHYWRSNCPELKLTFPEIKKLSNYYYGWDSLSAEYVKKLLQEKKHVTKDYVFALAHLMTKGNSSSTLALLVEDWSDLRTEHLEQIYQHSLQLDSLHDLKNVFQNLPIEQWLEKGRELIELNYSQRRVSEYFQEITLLKKYLPSLTWEQATKLKPAFLYQLLPKRVRVFEEWMKKFLIEFPEYRSLKYRDAHKEGSEVLIRVFNDHRSTFPSIIERLAFLRLYHPLGLTELLNIQNDMKRDSFLRKFHSMDEEKVEEKKEAIKKYLIDIEERKKNDSNIEENY